LSRQDNYALLVADNLKKVFAAGDKALEKTIPGKGEKGAIHFRAFGDDCRIAPDGITLGGKTASPVVGILISLYALHATAEVMITEPLRGYSEFADTMPYVGAFASHTENVLVDHVEEILIGREAIASGMEGTDAAHLAGGDFSFLLRPLPKIALCYIFYQADDDFPASVKCLFSANADRFLPPDALADVGEYTTKKILEYTLGGES
jgi:hypothetical protein